MPDIWNMLANGIKLNFFSDFYTKYRAVRHFSLSVTCTRRRIINNDHLCIKVYVKDIDNIILNRESG